MKGKPILDSTYYRRKKVKIGMAMNMFFFQKGILESRYEDAIDLARAVLPGTKFSQASFNWYRNEFTKRYILKESPTSCQENKKLRVKKGKTTMGKGDKRHRKHDKKKKETVTKTSKTVKSEKKTKGPKKVTIKSIVYDYFDEHGTEDVNFKKLLKIVLKKHPDSKFQATHVTYYKGQYDAQ